MITGGPGSRARLRSSSRIPSGGGRCGGRVRHRGGARRRGGGVDARADACGRQDVTVVDPPHVAVTSSATPSTAPAATAAATASPPVRTCCRCRCRCRCRCSWTTTRPCVPPRAGPPGSRRRPGALVKLEQVLPRRLRGQVTAVQGAVAGSPGRTADRGPIRRSSPRSPSRAVTTRSSPSTRRRLRRLPDPHRANPGGPGRGLHPRRRPGRCPRHGAAHAGGRRLRPAGCPYGEGRRTDPE